jgi:polyisoprenyl-phosphate glycosyltransferase
MSRLAVDEFRKFREKNRYVRGMVTSLGFKQVGVQFDRPDRFAGETHYPLKKMIKLAFDGITSFSTAPLQMITNIGFAVVGLSILGILYALVMRIFFAAVTVPGWTLIIIAILFIGGLQIMMTGIMGTYIGRIYTEVQQRPLYTIAKIYRHDS